MANDETTLWRRFRALSRPYALLLALAGLAIVVFGPALGPFGLAAAGLVAVVGAWLLWSGETLAMPLPSGAADPQASAGNGAGEDEATPPPEDGTAPLGGRVLVGGPTRRLRIRYEDAKGHSAEREIAVYAVVERNGVVQIDAFVRDQMSCRTYRADRIRRLHDLDENAVVEDDVIGHLTASESRAEAGRGAGPLDG